MNLFLPGTTWVLIGSGLFETGESVLQRTFFRESEQKGQRGFGPLILAQSINVKPIAATAGAGIVKRHSQIVSTEEPLEGAARFRDPEHIARGMIRFDAC